MMNDTMNAAADVLKDGANAVAESYRSSREKMHDLEAGMQEQIQEWPMSSVLVAIAVGLVFGYFLRGGTRHKTKRSRK